MLLPPAPDTCPICATKHKDDQPHNGQSMYYQYRFYGQAGRWPTWADAIAHCSELVRALWKRALVERGLWTEPEAGVELVAQPPAEAINQPIGDPNTRNFGPEQ